MLLCLVSFFDHGHFTHAQNVESFKIGEALDTLSFVKKACQHPSIKLLNIVSSSSQLKPQPTTNFSSSNPGKLETHG